MTAEEILDAVKDALQREMETELITYQFETLGLMSFFDEETDRVVIRAIDLEPTMETLKLSHDQSLVELLEDRMGEDEDERPFVKAVIDAVRAWEDHCKAKPKA
jgi:hypothetical protein